MQAEFVAILDTGKGNPRWAGGPDDLPPSSSFAPMVRLLSRALDEVDYGIILLSGAGEVLHLNFRSRKWLKDGRLLFQDGDCVRARNMQDTDRLLEALHGATQQGKRQLLVLGTGQSRQTAALIPVEPGVAALLLGKHDVCEDLSLQCFARAQGLTAAETRVLAALGAGDKPSDIARAQGVQIATIRTQISAIREKVGVHSITALLRLVASLPPMVGILRS